MQNFLIIPKINNLDESLKLAEEYGFGFEYNDFFIPDIMDDKSKKKEFISTYKSVKLPSYNTMHGAFFDVIVFSEDKKVREEKQVEIKHTDHGAMIPEIVMTSAEKKTGLEPIKETLGIK